MNPELARRGGDVSVAIREHHVDVLPARAREREYLPLRRRSLGRKPRVFTSERGEDLLRCNRFRQVVVRAELHRSDTGCDRWIRRAQHDAHLRVYVAQGADKRQAATARDPDVEQNVIRRARLRFLERRVEMVGDLDLDTRASR